MRHGSRKQEPLSERAAEPAKGRMLRAIFDAFGHRPELKCVRERNDGACQRGTVAATRDSVDETLVDLEHVHRELP